MAKKVPVTSVTPKSTTSKVGKKQQARTRELASMAFPYGKAGKALSTAKRVVGGIAGKGSKSVNPVYKSGTLKDSGGHVQKIDDNFVKKMENQKGILNKKETDEIQKNFSKYLEKQSKRKK